MSAKKQRAIEVLGILEQTYPDAECALEHRDPWQLLCATILSAQCTDERVNKVTPHLFAAYPNVQALAVADPLDVEAIVKSTGFFRQKTKSLIEMSQDIVAKHGGRVPQTMEELTQLRGVGRKTANVILGVAFGGDGMVVDTHVRRISRLLGWTKQDDPVKIEQDLMRLLPKDRWTQAGHLLIWHGRRLCIARRPKCFECPVAHLCPSATQDKPKKASKATP